MDLEKYKKISLKVRNNEEYEIKCDNIAELVILSDKKDISKQCKVIFNFSKEALIGFGTYCIRFAQKYKDNTHYHVNPIGNELSNQSMGFFLTPESPELIIGSKNFSALVTQGYANKENSEYIDFEIDYLVDLTFDNDYFEYHNLGFCNVAELIVLHENVNISNKCTVVFKFSKNGLIGIGTELIRLAHNYNKDINLSIEPTGNYNILNCYGFLLTSNSSSLTIGCKSLNNVFFYDQDFGKR